MGLWNKYLGNKGTTTVADQPTTDTSDVQNANGYTIGVSEDGERAVLHKNGETETPTTPPIAPPRPYENPPVQSSFLIEARLKQNIAAYVRSSLDAAQRQRILALTESVLSEILEEEISEIVGPKFEPLYEGVITEVVQKFLLKALAQRQQAVLEQLTKG